MHNGKPRYQCIKEPGRPNCGEVAVYAHRAGDEARDKILTALDGSPALLAALMRHHQADAATGDSEDVGAKLRQIDGRRDELAAAWAEGEISRKEGALRGTQLPALPPAQPSHAGTLPTDIPNAPGTPFTLKPHRVRHACFRAP